VIVILLRTPGYATIVETVPVGRIEPDRLSVIRDGVVMVVFCKIGVAARRKGGGVRTETDGCGIVGNGAVVVLPCLIGDAAIVETVVIGRIETDRVGVVCDRAALVMF
jgi:hypothetical protein